MIETKNKISIHQLQILIIFNILGSSFLTFPKLISKSAGNSFLFSIILGTAFVALSAYLILYSLSLKNSENTIEFFENTFGKFVTKIIVLLFIFKIVVSLVPVVTIFLDMTKNILLPKTNENIILILFLLLTCYLCYKEQSVRAKTSQLIFYIFILYILFFVVVSMFSLNLETLPNVTYVTLSNLTQGSFVTLFSFSSIIYLFFDYYYVSKKDSIIKSSVLVLSLLGLLLLFMSVIAISTFTLQGVTFLDFPAFDTMSRLSISNSFITRSEAIVFNFWIFVIFSYVATGVFYGHLLIYEIVKIQKINKKIYIFLFAGLIFLLCSLHLDQTAFKIIDVYLSTFLMIILPCLIILRYKFSSKKVATMVLLICILPIFLTSCSDKIELENRRFAYEMYIDKENDNFVLYYAYPDSNDVDSKKLIVNTASDSTLLGCLNKSYMNSENIIDFRQVKTIILTTNILKDKDMLTEVFDIMSKSNQVSNNTFVVSTDENIEDMLGDKTTKETSLSYYLSNFLKNNKNNYITSINFDLDSILLRIRNNQVVVIPSVAKTTGFEVNGSVILQDFSYVNFMNLDLTSGYAFLEKNAYETIIEFKYNNKNMFTKVLDSSSKTKFYEKDNKLYVVYSIKDKIDFMKSEYAYNEQNLDASIKKTINQEILKMCNSTFEYFKQNNVDGLYLADKLSKQDKKLYEKYIENNPDFLKKIEFQVDVKTEVIIK